MERYLDFDEITARALDVTCATLAVALPAAARAELSDAWTHLPAHPDAPAALATLRARGTRMVVLSNGTPRALERTVREAGIAGAFDALLSVAAVRAYKPRPAVYRLSHRVLRACAGAHRFRLIERVGRRRGGCVRDARVLVQSHGRSPGSDRSAAGANDSVPWRASRGIAASRHCGSR